MKNKIKQSKGITLIALVITIIVLLILAGVTLNIVLNSGIINKSQTATSKYNEQAAKEKLTLALTEYKFKQLAGETPDLAIIISNIGGEVTGGTNSADTEWTIDLDGYIFTVNKKTNAITSIEPSNSTPLEAPEIGTKTFTLATGNESATIKVTAIAKNGGTLTVTIDNKTATLVGSEYTMEVDTNGDKEIKVTETVGSKTKTTTSTINVTGIVEPTPASKDSTADGYVGCYADIDGNGTIDGIIYADLLVGKPTGDWANTEGTYTLPTDVNTSNVKDYVVSANQLTDERFEKAGADSSTYTARYVVSPASSSTGIKDRFYVMGLEDIKDTSNNAELYWYYSANLNGMSDYSTYTSVDFGKGKENTTKMLTKWNETGYGAQDNKDLWKWINVGAEQTNAGWFVPSRGEWAAFAKAFNIIGTSDYYKYGLVGGVYWTSSQIDNTRVWHPYFARGNMGASNVNYDEYVRLSTTF